MACTTSSSISVHTKLEDMWLHTHTHTHTHLRPSQHWQQLWSGRGWRSSSPHERKRQTRPQLDGQHSSTAQPQTELRIEWNSKWVVLLCLRCVAIHTTTHSHCDYSQTCSLIHLKMCIHLYTHSIIMGSYCTWCLRRYPWRAAQAPKSILWLDQKTG